MGGGAGAIHRQTRERFAGQAAIRPGPGLAAVAAAHENIRRGGNVPRLCLPDHTGARRVGFDSETVAAGAFAIGVGGLIAILPTGRAIIAAPAPNVIIAGVDQIGVDGVNGDIKHHHIVKAA